MRLKSREAREFRWQMIVSLSKENKSQSAIAALLGICQSSVSRVLARLGQGEGLKSKKPPGAKSKLTIEQKKELESLLLAGSVHYGFQSEMWTDTRIVGVIKEKFGVTYSDRQVNTIVKAMGFSKQRFSLKDAKQEAQQVENWHEQELPAIKKAHSQKRIIGYQDETAICLCPVVKSTYAKRGHTPTLSVSDSKAYQHLSLSGFISQQGDLKYEVRQGSFNGKAIQRFLRREFGGRNRQRYTLIWDGASIHGCQEVKEFLQADEKRQRVLLYKIPPYCPQLNPVELLWRYLKGVSLANVVCKTLTELKQKVIIAMEEIKKDKELIKSFFLSKKIGFMQS